MSIRCSMLTTVDNPYDPFTEYPLWFSFDSLAGYHTPGLLARIAVVSDDLSDELVAAHLEEAMDEIVRENVSGMHRKVTREIEGT